LYSLLFVCQKLACGANKNVQKQLRVRVTWRAISRRLTTIGRVLTPENIFSSVIYREATGKSNVTRTSWSPVQQYQPLQPALTGTRKGLSCGQLVLARS